MKAIKNTLVLITLTFGMLVGYGLEKVSKGNYISVTDETGEIVYSGRANYNGSIKQFYDLVQLQNGKYTVEIDKNFEIEINSIEVKNNSISTLDKATKKIHKPVFTSVEDKLIVSKLAFYDKEIKIELFFENELIYSETSKNKESLFDRIYKLDNSQKGNYKIILKSNNRSFSKDFKI